MKIPVNQKLSSNNFLVSMLSVPTVIIVGVGLALILFLLRSSATRLDAAQQEADGRIAHSVIATLQTVLEKNVADYASWDEMYDHTSKPIDPQWAQENLGPYSVSAFGLSHLLVLDLDGSIKYNFSSEPQINDELTEREATELKTSVNLALAKWQPGVFRGFSGVMSIGGRPHLVALAPISISSERRLASAAKPTSVLIFARELDDSVLGKLASDFELKRLRVTTGATGLLPLNGLHGAFSQFSLTWAQSEPGTQFYADAIPSVILVGVAVIAMFVILGFGWAMIIGRIRKTEIRALIAEDTSKSKSLFIANMSHELRTPLNAIIGFSELISKEMFGALSNPKYKEYAGDIHSSGNHLLGVVNNLLLFSKMEAGQHRVSSEPLCLEEEVSGVARVMQVEAEKRNIRIVQAAIPKTVTVSADQQSLRQVLFNVIGNAVKFSEAGGEVRIEAGGMMPGGKYELRIVDQGCGIPESTLSELGNAFVQAENTYARKYQGTGLGLAICFGLAQQMGGSIKIASTENVGTSVSIIVPTCRTDGAAAAHKQSQPETTAVAAPTKELAVA